MTKLIIVLSTALAFLYPVGVALAEGTPPPPVDSGADRDTFDPESGTARKCYVVTRDDIRYGERPGIDPATGRECRPVTAEVIERLRLINGETDRQGSKALIRPSSACAPANQLFGITKMRMARYNFLI
jgi:hypothetical protein